MSIEVISLSSQVYLPLTMLAAGVLIGIAIEQFRVILRRRSWREKNRRRWNTAGAVEAAERSRRTPDLVSIMPRRPDAADQLRIVMGAEFHVQPVLNRSEARVFRELDRMVLTRNPGWQVMAQVSLGEILRSKDSLAFSCINSKRVDLLLMDENCRPRHAVEYQGGGHHQGTAAARDAVKKEALRRAGIAYHEVIAGHTTPSELARLVERLVDVPTEMAQ